MDAVGSTDEGAGADEGAVEGADEGAEGVESSIGDMSSGSQSPYSCDCSSGETGDAGATLDPPVDVVGYTGEAVDAGYAGVVL